MKKYNVGILGATGAVGQEMMKILAERSFPVGELRLLASRNSAGKEINGHVVVEACRENFEGLDIILGAAENDIAERFVDDIKASGAVFIDNSSAFRLCPDVPLVVPEINPEDVKKHKGVIANPNCTTVISCTAVNALNAVSPIESMVVSSYQAVSGAGAAGPKELFGEVEALAKGESYEPEGFCVPDRLQRHSADRRRAVCRLYLRGDEASERGQTHHASPRAEGQLHLCARARRAQPQRFHLPENQRKNLRRACARGHRSRSRREAR